MTLGVIGTVLHLLAQAPRAEHVERHVELARWSTGNALIVGALATAACMYAVVWMYRREARGRVTGRFRWGLVAVRVAVLLLLGFIGLEPELVDYLHRRIDAVTIVLSDASASMTLADRYRRSADAERVSRLKLGEPSAGLPREQIVQHLLGSGDDPLAMLLAENNAVRWFDFAGRMDERLALPRIETSLPISQTVDVPPRASGLGPADVEATDLSAAVRGAIDSLGGAPVAAVVLVSDGNFNRGEPIDAVARLLQLRNVPVHAIGVGDPAPPVNVAVREVSAPRHAFKNDPFNVTVRLEAHGAEGQPITVQLWQQSPDGSAPRRIGSQTARAEIDGLLEPVVFEQKAAAPGPVTYLARAEPLEHEAITADNARAISPPVQILDDKVRVLVIAGAPTYDYRYLARMLERDPGIEVALWLQSADARAVREGNVILTEPPATQDELFKYDAIILMDADPAEFDPTWASLVAAFMTDHGGGVLVQAGNKYTGKLLRNPRTASLVEMLPVSPDADAEILLNDLGHFQTRAWPILIPDAALADPILRLGGAPGETRAQWSQLDGVYWHYPVRREKPVASVLMRHGDPRMAGPFGPQVLLATQYVGAGRCAWLGFNSTWRWRRADEKPFNRFWIQTIRFLVEGRLAGGRSRGQIITDRDEFDVGQAVSLTLRALDPRFAPHLAAELELTVQPPRAADRLETPQDVDEAFDSPNGATGPAGPATGAADAEHATAISLRATPIPGREGYYQARFNADRPGVYRASFSLPDADDARRSVTIEREIAVTRPDIEMRNTALNRAALKQLVAATGGRYYDVDEAGRLPAAIPDAGRSQITRQRPRPLWDNAAVFALLLALLTAEWVMRRQARLL